MHLQPLRVLLLSATQSSWEGRNAEIVSLKPPLNIEMIPTHVCMFVTVKKLFFIFVFFPPQLTQKSLVIGVDCCQTNAYFSRH